MAARVLIVSASIGEGHDLPARVLAGALQRAGAQAQVIDALHAAGPWIERIAHAGTRYDTRLGNATFDVAHRFVAQWSVTSRLVASIISGLARRGIGRAVTAARPDVVVSTYPGASDVLGRMRRRGTLQAPLLSAITDLASLRYWAHPGVDEHLLVHPESVGEVRAIAGPRARAVAVHGLTDPAFLTTPARGTARQALGLPAVGRVIVVSGGGWAVGDLEGAVDAALATGAAAVVVLCGRSEEVLARMAARHDGDSRVRPWGFTERMPELLAAADALVHSTAGLTVVEALMAGCPVISYGWGKGHIRENNRAYEHFGLAIVARDRASLHAALDRTLAAPRPAPWHPDLPDAVERVLAWAGDLPRS